MTKMAKKNLFLISPFDKTVIGIRDHINKIFGD